jgi:hypothetical protein
MPSTAVYFEALPLSIALIAACLMLSGVSKSGSPAPSPITLRPAALSARALSVTAMVAEGWMRLSEAASTSDGEAGLSWTAGIDMGFSVCPQWGRELPKGPGCGRQASIGPDRECVYRFLSLRRPAGLLKNLAESRL